MERFLSLLQNKKIIMIYLIAFCVMGCFVCTYNFISYVLMAEPYNLSQTIIGFILCALFSRFSKFSRYGNII